MKYVQFSTDGGKTYVDMDENVRIIFHEVDEDDYEMHDLHVCVTDEGVILDVYGEASGDLKSTMPLDTDELVALTQ